VTCTCGWALLLKYDDDDVTKLVGRDVGVTERTVGDRVGKGLPTGSIVGDIVN
jgi:hypothetical protein